MPQQSDQQSLTSASLRRLIWGLAIPNIVSNITVPLLSLVDVGLAGNMSVYGSIGAVALASVVVNTLYWLFGFLRMGTTGLVAQAYGANDVEAINRNLGRGVVLALLIGLLLSLLMPLMAFFVHVMAQGDAEMATQAERYIRIALLGAPATMLLYVFNGWFIGMQNTRTPMVGAILVNVINIFISYLCVRGLDMGVEGLAWGTIGAQYIGVIFLWLRALFSYRSVLAHFRAKDLLQLTGARHYLGVNRDLFLRSILLSGVTLFFTYASTAEGELIVSSNTLLLQFFTLFSYFMDGFAYAGEALAGRFIGMKQRVLLQRLVHQLFAIGVPLTLLAGLLYYLLPAPLLHLLSSREDIVQTAMEYVHWAALIPPMGFAAFLWDGIFIGGTYAKGLLWSMLWATALFFILYYSLHPILGVTALWIAFNAYLLTRGVVQTLLFPRFLRRLSF
ncbi:MATE family efflux transporter [Porphyromonas circumdentaria]|uniref:Multidrug resistance protein, MATE family n=1 Tax=Porphyromonas circumdentaria TaxID=29524 RepID=A0A1T4PN66_9PORP|nr:MATE family efflux transporter [Porphyromonas circumdentaria]MBB6276481.1 MATE family multidrug resistance protein [Porphyromonas circumdentaria]MDO4722471.1 MATE family efflux transporter [Porphyromonas circumdentaria]SJZ92973.1 multidrug resistance protein, MATE family [Porphyromonas circumdentaria]